VIGRARIWGFAVALAALTPVFAAPAVADSCTKLSSLVLPEVISITATSIAADSFTPSGLTTPVPVAFCRVQITVTPAINIEVWLPPAANWNHRFQAEGGGGYAGVISYSALVMAVTGDAVTGQFATASTDTGHPATGTANGQGGANDAQAGGGFALNPADDTLNEGLIVDFASRSLHEMTLKAKAVIRAYYSKPQNYSYWNGCSTGGRQGWVEAQMFPEDYDGILAGAPAFNWDRFIPAELWPELALAWIIDDAVDHAVESIARLATSTHIRWYAGDLARQLMVLVSIAQKPMRYSRSGAVHAAHMESSCGTDSNRAHPLPA